jgi:hypothetical protein
VIDIKIRGIEHWAMCQLLPDVKMLKMNSLSSTLMPPLLL